MTLTLLVELLARYGRALRETWPFAVAALGVAAAFLLPAVRQRLERLTPAARWILLGLVGLGAVLWGWQLRWLCDDAFISFRYADNLARGHGLVFNPDERIEGYTNFLWTVLLAGFIKMGADPGQVAVVLGLGCFVVMVVLLARLGERLSTAAASMARGVGIAPLLAAASYTIASFATSGLETMFAATLAVAAVERAEARRPLAAGLLGVAAAMAHPDHGIFYAALGLALLSLPERRREIARFAAPFVFVYLPYFLWRWHYYGELVPNTFHAKSADQTYFSQGVVYLVVTWVAAGLWGVMPLAVLGAVRFRQMLIGRFALIALPLFLFYVAKIGGDFMLGRLLTPAVAFLFLLADLGFRDLLGRGRWKAAAVLIVPACAAALPTKVIAPGEKKWHIADERTFYHLQSFTPVEVGSIYTHQARTLASAFPAEATAPKLAVGCVGLIGYITRLPIFDLFGLTSRSVARMPIVGRGRPGHEKLGTPGHVFASGADVSDLSVYPEPYSRLTALDFPGFRYYLVRYDPALLPSLRASARFTDFAHHLDQSALASGPQRSEDVACDLWFLQSYYFSRNVDPERRDRALRHALAADSGLRGAEALLLTAEPPAALGYRPVRAMRFEDRAGWSAAGDAFASWPSRAASPGQGEVFGHEGGFINTFTPTAQDGARGSLRSDPFVIEGDAITLMVGGGRDIERVRISLLVEGRPVRSASGCRSEILGRRVWSVGDFRGMTAHLEVVDDSTDAWGHVVVDEIVEWQISPRNGP
jgi:hypothetical protein